MTGTLWLRISSIIAFLFALGHTWGGISAEWSPVGETETLRLMKSYHMAFSGVSRSYYDFFMGFGYSLSVSMFLEAILLWLLAGLAKEQPAKARPFVAAFFLASLLNVGISWKFIFPVPVIFGLVLTACIGVSYLLLAKQTQHAPQGAS
jgi:hypothetical protein